MTRRSLFKTAAAAFCGSLLAKLPFAGKAAEVLDVPEPILLLGREQIWEFSVVGDPNDWSTSSGYRTITRDELVEKLREAMKAQPMEPPYLFVNQETLNGYFDIAQRTDGQVVNIITRNDT